MLKSTRASTGTLRRAARAGGDMRGTYRCVAGWLYDTAVLYAARPYRVSTGQRMLCFPISAKSQVFCRSAKIVRCFVGWPKIVRQNVPPPQLWCVIPYKNETLGAPTHVYMWQTLSNKYYI